MSFYIGQNLYEERVERGMPTTIVEHTVTKIGSKFFYTDKLGERYPYEKETLLHRDKVYTQHNRLLHRSRYALLESIHSRQLVTALEKFFSAGKARNFSHADLSHIATILNLDVPFPSL